MKIHVATELQGHHFVDRAASGVSASCVAVRTSVFLLPSASARADVVTSAATSPFLGFTGKPETQAGSGNVPRSPHSRLCRLGRRGGAGDDLDDRGRRVERGPAVCGKEVVLRHRSGAQKAPRGDGRDCTESPPMHAEFSLRLPVGRIAFSRVGRLRGGHETATHETGNKRLSLTLITCLVMYLLVN